MCIPYLTWYSHSWYHKCFTSLRRSKLRRPWPESSKKERRKELRKRRARKHLSCLKGLKSTLSSSPFPTHLLSLHLYWDFTVRISVHSSGAIFLSEFSSANNCNVKIKHPYKQCGKSWRQMGTDYLLPASYANCLRLYGRSSWMYLCNSDWEIKKNRNLETVKLLVNNMISPLFRCWLWLWRSKASL